MSKQIPINVLKYLINKESKEYFTKREKIFQVDNDNRDFLNIISMYFSNSPKFEEVTDGSLKKGLWVTGNCGTGKSSMFDVIQIISQKHSLPHLHFKNITVNSVISDYNMEGEHIVKRYTKGKVHFDDLGTEKQVNNWGIKEELMKRIIEIRYDNFKANAVKTYITTNLSIKQVKSKYGERVYSRLFEMFNFLELNGKDRRIHY